MDIGLLNDAEPKMFFVKQFYFVFILGINRVFSEMMTTNFMVFYQSLNPPSIVKEKILNSVTIRLLFFNCINFETKTYRNHSTQLKFDVETEKLFHHFVEGFIKIAIKDKYNKVVDAARGSNVGAPIRTQLQVAATTTS